LCLNEKTLPTVVQVDFIFVGKEHTDKKRVYKRKRKAISDTLN